MMIDYIVFFSMLIVAVLLAICFKPQQDQHKLSYVSDFQKCESPIERRVYKGLVLHGLYPDPQFRQGRYRIDLAFPSSSLAIECDGKDFHSSPKQKAHDREKDAYLKSKGWTVLRFSGSRIHRDLSGVVRKIINNLK